MVIMTPKEAYRKCIKEKKRTPELENIIANDPEWSYCYAYYVIKGPWERGEESISKDPKWSYYYAKDIIKGPWEQGEDTISKDVESSYFYTLNVIKGSFEKCHPIIFNSKYKNHYIDFLRLINYDINKISEWLI